MTGTNQHKPITQQDKTKPDKTRQDNARQQANTTQDNTTHDDIKTIQHQAQDKTKHKTRQYNIIQYKTRLGNRTTTQDNTRQ